MLIFRCSTELHSRRCVVNKVLTFRLQVVMNGATERKNTHNYYVLLLASLIESNARTTSHHDIWLVATVRWRVYSRWHKMTPLKWAQNHAAILEVYWALTIANIRWNLTTIFMPGLLADSIDYFDRPIILCSTVCKHIHMLTMLHCCNTVGLYLQHGGGNYCGQHGDTMTPWIRYFQVELGISIEGHITETSPGQLQEKAQSKWSACCVFWWWERHDLPAELWDSSTLRTVTAWRTVCRRHWRSRHQDSEHIERPHRLKQRQLQRCIVKSQACTYSTRA